MHPEHVSRRNRHGEPEPTPDPGGRNTTIPAVANTLVLVVDTRGTIRAASADLVQHIGLKADTLVGKSCLRVPAVRNLLPVEAFEAFEAIGGSIRKARPVSVRDRALPIGQAPLIPLLSAGNEIKSFVLYAVAPANESHAGLDESANRFLSLVKNIPQGVFYKDRQSVYRACNHAYAEDLGTTPQAIVDKTEYDFHPPALADRFVEQDRRIVVSGATECTEAVHFEQGEERLVYKVKTPVWDAADRVIGILGILWDITDRKRTESHLRRIVELQTNALDLFAHSIRDPLTVIRGYTTMLRESTADRLSREETRMIESIADGAQQLVSITETFLDADRIEEAAWSLRTSRVPLDEVIYRAVDRFSDAALRKGLTITVQAEQGVFVAGDEELLMEAVSNLLSNAIRYSDRGTITASLQRTLDEALVSITDEGRGIPERDLPHIFRKFYRIAHHDSGENKGLGLGLPLAKSIVESHTGFIDVASRPGRGSAFTIHLPLHVRPGPGMTSDPPIDRGWPDCSSPSAA